MTQTATLLPIQQFFDTNTGQFLSGGQITSYIAGSSTPQSLYSDSTGSTPLPNPLTLGSDGKNPGGIWGVGNYKIVISNATNSETIWTIDQISTGISNFTAQNATGIYAFGAVSSTPSQLVLAEALSNGSDTYTLACPATLTGNRIFTLPDADINWPTTVMGHPVIVDAQSTSTTSCANSTDTQITLGTINVNVGAGFASNTFTAPISGTYKVSCGASTAAFGSGVANFACKLFYNGGSVRSAATVASFGVSVSISMILNMTLNDTLALYVNQTDGTTVACSGYISIQRIA